MPLSFWLKPLLVAALSVLGASHWAKHNQDKIDQFFMGIFRDIGRHKALKRRNANSKGLIATVIFKQDNPLLDLEVELDDDNNNNKWDNLQMYTRQELEEFGSGQGEGQQLLISLFGRVYDVSAGKKFYGPGGPYHIFAGHDVTYALSTGCFRDYECVAYQDDNNEDESTGNSQKRKVESLTDKQLSEGKRWLSFFHLHDKYPMVGRLEEGDYVETLLRDLIRQAEQEAQQQQQQNGGSGKPLQPPPLVQDTEQA